LSSSSGIEIVASGAKSVNAAEFRALAPSPENRGAGGRVRGRGLLGLSLYLDSGDLGLGAPLISAGSNLANGGGRPRSDEPRDGVQGRVGEIRPVGEYGLYDASGWDI
jgi:hypothetical protein